MLASLSLSLKVSFSLEQFLVTNTVVLSCASSWSDLDYGPFGRIVPGLVVASVRRIRGHVLLISPVAGSVNMIVGSAGVFWVSPV